MADSEVRFEPGVAGFGQRLAHARRRLGLLTGRTVPQAEVARKFKVTRGTVSSWEGGTSKPDAELMERLAAYMRVDPAWLIVGAGDDPLNIDQRADLVERHAESRVPQSEYERPSLKDPKQA